MKTLMRILFPPRRKRTTHDRLLTRYLMEYNAENRPRRTYE